MRDPTYAFKVRVVLVSKWQYVKGGLHSDRGKGTRWRGTALQAGRSRVRFPMVSL